MDIITTHPRTDFDALAAMVACWRLHPGAKMILPGALRANVREFVSLHRDTYDFHRPSDINLEGGGTLYLVDMADCKRLGSLAGLCQRAAQVVVYDHHPGPLPSGYQGISEALGAATTIVVELLRNQGVKISALDATLFLLGIYDDTGCLTYPSTNVRDLKAAVWLFEQGANLDQVAKYINSPLSPIQRRLFENMLASAQIEEINGHKILIAQATTDDYIGGLDKLTRHLSDLEACSAVISIVQMEDRVHLVGRSLRPPLNLLELLAPLGVAGHPGAISLTVRNQGPEQLGRDVLAALRARMQDGCRAGDIMSSPVKSIQEGVAIEEANRLLLRYGHTGMPVIGENKQLAGVISRRDVDKAIRHGLGHAPVKGYMTRKVISVSPEAGIDEVSHLIIHNDIGRLPVLAEGELVGIITRTDVLREMHGDSPPRWHRPLYTQRDYDLAQPQDNVTELVNSRLPKRLQGLLLLLGQKADKEGFKAYVVGGFVRDLILGVANYDLDIVIEDNAIKFARSLMDMLGGKLHVHEEFGTASLVLADGYQIDFATARLEFYQFPAAAPEVEQTTIRHDLYRRDFTVNTMAFCLNSSSFGNFLDFFGGYDDLKVGLIRVLYNLSFVEDPTRILRAARFACRYGFEIESETRTFLANAVREEILVRASESRLGHELRLFFQEANVPALLETAHSIGVLGSLFPGLDWSEDVQSQLQAAGQVLAWNSSQPAPVFGEWMVYPILLLKELTVLRRRETLRRLGLTSRELGDVELVTDQFDRVGLELSQSTISASDIYQLLQAWPMVGLLALLAAWPQNQNIRSRVLLYLEELSDIELEINGHDLIGLGYKPGPGLGKVLKAVQRARLDGEINTRDEEMALAKQLLDWEKGDGNELTKPVK